MSGELCSPTIAPPKELTREDLAHVLAPQTPASLYPSKKLDGTYVYPDIAPRCTGPNQFGECPTVLLLNSLRGRGGLPPEYPIPYRFQGCLFAHSQP